MQNQWQQGTYGVPTAQSGFPQQIQQGMGQNPQAQQAVYGAGNHPQGEQPVQQVYQRQSGDAGFGMPVAPQVAQHTGTQHRSRAHAFHRDKTVENHGTAGGAMMTAHPGTMRAESRGTTVKESLARLCGLQVAGRNLWLLLGAVVGTVWFGYMIVMLSRAVNMSGLDSGYELAVQELRAGISVFMQMPSILSGFAGMIFNWLAWAYRRRSLALTAAILYGAAVMLSFGQSLGYGAFMAVNMVGYFQMRK